MSYTVLYRKMRPTDFSGIIGQDAIVKTLKNQLASGRLSHAYLFCGTRGTGKTSTAKILAKAVNCLNLQEGEPCNDCSSCKAINEARSLNVVEIDAASNNGVDNIREIRDEVRYAPADSKYRVYIIDEVHMLSAGAFNALLKTLEEPPDYCIFILATTDPQKIPATVLSRVQRYDFKRVRAVEMTETLGHYMEHENISVDEQALRYIVSITDGDMRGALSILDQCISYYYHEAITIEKVLTVTGSVSGDVFFKVVDALNLYNAAMCMEIVDEIVINGRDIMQFLSELVTHVRNLLVAKAVSGESRALDFATENVEKLRVQAKSTDSGVLIEYIRELSELQQKIKYASNPRVFLEVTLIKLCNPETEESSDAFDTRLRKVEESVSRGLSISHTVVSERPKEALGEAQKQKKPKAVPEDVKKVILGYSEFVKSIADIMLQAYLEKCKPGCSSTGVLQIIGEKSLILSRERVIVEELSRHFGKTFDPEFVYSKIEQEDDWAELLKMEQDFHR